MLVDALLGKPSVSFMMISVRCQKRTRITFGRIGLSGLEFPEEPSPMFRSGS